MLHHDHSITSPINESAPSATLGLTPQVDEVTFVDRMLHHTDQLRKTGFAYRELHDEHPYAGEFRTDIIQSGTVQGHHCVRLVASSLPSNDIAVYSTLFQLKGVDGDTIICAANGKLDGTLHEGQRVTVWATKAARFRPPSDTPNQMIIRIKDLLDDTTPFSVAVIQDSARNVLFSDEYLLSLEETQDAHERDPKYPTWSLFSTPCFWRAIYRSLAANAQVTAQSDDDSVTG